MAVTMGGALAAQLRAQIQQGEDALAAARIGGADRSDAVIGSPCDVLSVRGNVSDVAHTNHLWLLDVAAAGLCGELPTELRQARPTTIEGAVAFLAPRDTDSATQGLAQLRRVNEFLASQVEGLSDADLERRLEMTFYGDKSLRDALFSILHHGSLHIGQAWGILKGAGYSR